MGLLLYIGGSQVAVQGLSEGLKGIEPVVKECRLTVIARCQNEPFI